jgi:MraZ protein
MFMGTYEHTIDDKGRLAIPSRFREILADRKDPENLVLTLGLDNCLFGYAADEWRKLEEKITARPMNKGDERFFVRRLFAGAVDCPFDKQGRIVLPQLHRKHADLQRDVLIIGVSTRIEIWDPARWQSYLQQGRSLEEIAEQIEDF